MDDVDKRYKDSIRGALQSKDVSRLMELVPSIDEETARKYIEKWIYNYNETVEKTRSGFNTDFNVEKSWDIINELLDASHLSGYHR